MILLSLLLPPFFPSSLLLLASVAWFLDRALLRLPARTRARDDMASSTDSSARNAVGGDPDENMAARTVPIITSPTPTPTIKTSAPSPAGDPMDITTPTNSSVPLPSQTSNSKSPEREGLDPGERHGAASSKDQNSRAMPAPAAAAAAVHQPKIVQTAFIHKLYKYVYFSLGVGIIWKLSC